MKINPKQKIHLFHYNHRTQQASPTDHFETKRNSQHKKQIIVPPINKKSTQQNFNVQTKRIRSLRQSKQVHRPQNNFKAPIFDINVLKNSLTGKKDGQEQDLKKSQRVKKQVPISTRIFTQNKINNTEGSDQSKQKNYDRSKQKTKPSFRSNIKTKSLQKTEGNRIKKPDYVVNQKIILFSKNQTYQTQNKNLQGEFYSKSKRSIQKYQNKLTSYEKQQIAKFQDVYYIGPRRIYSKSDFTDGESDPKVMVNDSIAYRYEVVSSLGHGSFGKVFKAFDHKKKQYVALKLIKSQKKFFQQAKVQVQILQCALFKDPKLKSNVVRMKGSFVFRGHSCITFEILHKNLYQFLKEHHFSGFSLDLIRRFAIQILQSLLFFRKNHIIHCDLKPQNILLKQENKSGIRVIDVGSGCFEAKQIYTYIQSRFYRAPQIILGIKYTPAIDMWSFGCILVQLFTGFPIFPGDSQNQQLLMFMQVLNIPPKQMLKTADRRKKFFNESLQSKIPQQKGKQRFPNTVKLQQIIGCKDTTFTDIVSRCLEWDPQKRITPDEALLHEWILKGLPQEIRQQHITQLSNLFFY